MVSSNEVFNTDVVEMNSQEVRIPRISFDSVERDFTYEPSVRQEVQDTVMESNQATVSELVELTPE
jgi:hypothetical protein